MLGHRSRQWITIRTHRVVGESCALPWLDAHEIGVGAATKQAQAEQIIHDDPLVQALMAQYKTARIVPGSIKPH